MANNDHILGYIPHFRTHPHVSPAIHWDVARGSPLRPDSDTFCTSLFLLAQGVTAHGAALANGKARVPAVFCESGYFVAVAIGATFFSANGVVGSRLDVLTTVFSVDLLGSWLEWQPVDLQISSSERPRSLDPGARKIENMASVVQLKSPEIKGSKELGQFWGLSSKYFPNHQDHQMKRLHAAEVSFFGVGLMDITLVPWYTCLVFFYH